TVMAVILRRPGAAAYRPEVRDRPARSHPPVEVSGPRVAGSDLGICSLCGAMTYVITGSCIKDDACIDACPADCIHPKPGAPDFETAEQLYIDPAVCIDCDACVEACPVDAIFDVFDIPEQHEHVLDVTADFVAGLSPAQRTAAGRPARDRGL